MLVELLSPFLPSRPLMVVYLLLLLKSKMSITAGEKIYTITHMELKSTQIEQGRYRKERTWEIKKYVYAGIGYGNIKISYSKVYDHDVEDSMVRFGSDSDTGSDQKILDKTEIRLPLDNRNQALLKTLDDKTIIITLVEDDKITAEEKE